MRIVIGITGSTGIIYGIRILEVLKKSKIETHLIMSEWAKKCLTLETKYDLKYVKSLADSYSDDSNMAASVSSGTYKTDGMIVIPCSMKTLSSIANGYDETLVARAAGVTIKEARKITERHETIERFANLLKHPEDKAHEEAHKLEHAFSPELINKLDRFMDNLHKTPAKLPSYIG